MGANILAQSSNKQLLKRMGSSYLVTDFVFCKPVIIQCSEIRKKSQTVGSIPHGSQGAVPPIQIKKSGLPDFVMALIESTGIRTPKSSTSEDLGSLESLSERLAELKLSF